MRHYPLVGDDAAYETTSTGEAFLPAAHSAGGECLPLPPIGHGLLPGVGTCGCATLTPLPGLSHNEEFFVNQKSITLILLV